MEDEERQDRVGARERKCLAGVTEQQPKDPLGGETWDEVPESPLP